jgi:hypothetical protein
MLPFSIDSKILFMETQTDEILSIFVMCSRSIREVIDMVWFDLELLHHKLFRLLIKMYSYCIMRHYHITSVAQVLSAFLK